MGLNGTSERRRRRFSTGLAAIVLAAAMAGAKVGADTVGFRDIVFEIDGERLTAALWYPTAAPPGRTAIGPFPMAAARDAPVGAGRYGLVLISHGTGGGRLNHRGTAMRLAGAGYVVAAPEHPGDSWRDGRYSGTAAKWRRRPRQLSATLDRLLGEAEFGRRIDPARIGAIGHSAGGYSVLALIGGRADMAVLARHCTRYRDRDPAFCAYGRQDERVGGVLPALSDRRIGAVVAVAPVGALFGDGAFAGVEVPAQIHRFGQDRILRRALARGQHREADGKPGRPRGAPGGPPFCLHLALSRRPDRGDRRAGPRSAWVRPARVSLPDRPPDRGFFRPGSAGAVTADHPRDLLIGQPGFNSPAVIR